MTEDKKGALAAKTLLRGQPILVAVSGGADSLAALFYLRQLGYDVTAASFDHQLRGQNGAEDVAYVSRVCRKFGIPFIKGSGNVAAHIEEYKLSIEEGARDLRYHFLFEQASKIDAQAVVTGHTADDQAETILMHFLRGAGLSGLRGMPTKTFIAAFSTHIPLVRPLLQWTRADTLTYCQDLGLSPRHDETNDDPKFLRNRLRLELIPLLKEYNPNLIETLARSAEVLHADSLLLDELTRESLQHTCQDKGDGYFLFSREKLRETPLPLLNRIIRAACFEIQPGLRDVDKEALDRFSLDKDCRNLGGKIHSLIEGDDLWLMQEGATLPKKNYPQITDTILLKIGPNFLSNGWVIDVRSESDSSGSLNNSNNDLVVLPIRDHEEILQARIPLHGEKIEPFGMPRQHMKISDLFVNVKVPRRYRPQYPVVTLGGKIVWIPGLRRSEIENKTGELAPALVLRLVKPQQDN